MARPFWWLLCVWSDWWTPPPRWLVLSLDSRLPFVFVLLVAEGAAQGANSVRASLAGMVLVVVVTAYLQPLLCWVFSSSHGLPWPSTKWPDLHPHWWVDLCSDLHLHPASSWLPLWPDLQLGLTLNVFFLWWSAYGLTLERDPIWLVVSRMWVYFCLFFRK